MQWHLLEPYGIVGGVLQFRNPVELLRNNIKKISPDKYIFYYFFPCNSNFQQSFWLKIYSFFSCSLIVGTCKLSPCFQLSILQQWLSSTPSSKNKKKLTRFYSSPVHCCLWYFSHRSLCIQRKTLSYKASSLYHQTLCHVPLAARRPPEHTCRVGSANTHQAEEKEHTLHSRQP